MSSSNLWHSPVPYIFIFLGVAMGLIAVSLIVLICSNNKSSEREDIESGRDRSVNINAIRPLGMEPKVVAVIMAGDNKPTFLAKSSYHFVIECSDEKSGYLCPSCSAQ